jgi:pimeloyl-ACP methyl ester carboxylesterase
VLTRVSGDHKSDFRAYSVLSDQYRVLSFDYRGHGQSSSTKPYTFSQIVDDIEGVRRHFAGPETKVIICGGSFGGFLAQQYAITYGQFVSHLILRGTAPSYHRMCFFASSGHSSVFPSWSRLSPRTPPCPRRKKKKKEEREKDAHSCTEEDDAIKVLETRVHKAPSFSVEMLKEKVFGAFDSDLEFQLVHLAMMPLYSEVFDANAALRNCLATRYNAEAHSESCLFCPSNIIFLDRHAWSRGEVTILANESPKQMTYTARKRSILITEKGSIRYRPRRWLWWETRIGYVHQVCVPACVFTFSFLFFSSFFSFFFSSPFSSSPSLFFVFFFLFLFLSNCTRGSICFN